MTAIAVPSLPQALETGLRGQRDDWDDSKLHISDLAVAIGEKCPRQLWLRLRGAEKKPESAGKLLMFDHGHRIHERLIEIIRSGLNNGWKIQAVEKQVSLGEITGRFDTRLWNETEGWEIIVDFKTLRGRAFGYLTEAKPSHVLQVQSYIAAADADGGLVFYVDREGENAARQFYVQRNDDRVWDAAETAIAIAKQEEPPPILEPKLKIGKNKGPDSVKLEQPWQCEYCEYSGPSCPGALPPNMRGLGIIGYLDEGEFKPKKGFEILSPMVEELADRQGLSPVPF